jgi:crotonobetainyl-CoA:carnitine CoA-transferase CaiB-like acyl-CoA transferase
MYGFVPSAGAVLGEWGADVVKVEHAVTGDPQRGLRQTGLLRVEGDPNPNIEHANRGKRSIGLDMSVPEGKEVLLELARRSDVFLTSFLPGHRQKFGIVSTTSAPSTRRSSTPGGARWARVAMSRSRAATT